MLTIISYNHEMTREKRKTCRPYSQEDDELIRKLYPTTRAREIAVKLKRSEKSIVARAFKLGLRKDRAFMLECAKAGQFKKGLIPHNKGKKWDEYVSKETQQKMLDTAFKKGNMPKQHREVGSERINKDGYVEIKVAEPNKWKHKHVHLWEEHHGESAKGRVVYFIDGDKTNITIENLAIIDRSEHIHNSALSQPIELRRLYQLKGALKRQLNKLER